MSLFQIIVLCICLQPYLKHFWLRVYSSSAECWFMAPMKNFSEVMDLLQSVGAWKRSVSNWQMNIAWVTALHNTTSTKTLLSVHHFNVQIIMFWKVMEEEEGRVQSSITFYGVRDGGKFLFIFNKGVELCYLPKKI